jgi:hypothetical protein
MEQVGPCLILAQIQTFTIPALSEIVRVGQNEGCGLRGGSIEMKILFFCMAVFYFVVSLKLNTELCTNTVQAINNEGYSYV